MPLDALNFFEGVPLTSTTKFADVKHPIIQLTPIRGTLIWIKMSLIYDQLTVSKAFTKSSLRMSAEVFLVLTE